MGRLFYEAEELLKRPIYPGMHDPTHLYYHFRPARPANLVVTRDRISGELNLSAGTFGVLTERPLTICLHSSKHSFDTVRNSQGIGAECVVSLPGRDIVNETWYTALPIPRGIFEADVANLTLLPSKVVSVPGIVECPVNLECRVEYVKDWYSHYALFLRVVAATVDEDVIKRGRLDLICDFPTYEVDDQTNPFGGAIERLGVNGELLECPGFPVGAKRGQQASSVEWIADLQQAGCISETEFSLVNSWLHSWETELQVGQSAKGAPVQAKLTRFFELAAWEEWDALHAFLADERA